MVSLCTTRIGKEGMYGITASVREAGGQSAGGVRRGILFQTLLAFCLLMGFAAESFANDGLDTFPPEIRSRLVAPVDVPAAPSAFPDVLREAIGGGPESYRQSILNALHWIGYARLRFENESLRAGHDIPAYNAEQITAVGMRMTYEAARKLKPFTLWNVLQLAQSLKTQMPEVYRGWIEMTDR
jgi:hypothetical protein